MRYSLPVCFLTLCAFALFAVARGQLTPPAAPTQQNATACVPSCLPVVRPCGDDGCGGSCGNCLEGEQCADRQCIHFDPFPPATDPNQSGGTSGGSTGGSGSDSIQGCPNIIYVPIGCMRFLAPLTNRQTLAFKCVALVFTSTPSTPSARQCLDYISGRLKP